MNSNLVLGAVKKAELPFKILEEHVATASGSHSVGTKLLAKGLETDGEPASGN